MGDSELVQNDDMASALFEHFNSILGQHFPRSTNVSFSAAGLPTLDLTQLDVVFSEQEALEVVASLPSDKAPGPNDFSGLFYKRAWPIIKEDIMRAFNAFWSRDFRSFNLVNEAYLILLRKKENPEEIKDYRPISLIHSFGKLVAKCLANRLSRFLNDLVRPNQSAFIRGRSIHDNFRTVQLTVRLLHSTRRPSILLKIDIAKAFDTVSWPFLLQLLEFMGFSRRWRDWMSALLSTASTKILLNGRPGDRICHARGLRQGDPLSPMLFVLVMEALNGLIGRADLEGVLNPLPPRAAACRASLYADDLVVFLAPVRGDVLAMREILRVFGEASGLFTNTDKCIAFPIRCCAEQTELFENLFGCRVSEFPGVGIYVY